MHIYHIRPLVYFGFTTMLMFCNPSNWCDFYCCWIKVYLSLSRSLCMMCIIGILHGYMIRSGKHPKGSQRLLTSRGMSAWRYHVTTQYYFYPVLMNNRSNNNDKKKVPHSLPNAVFIQSETHPGAPIRWSSSCKHSVCSQQTYGSKNALHKK